MDSREAYAERKLISLETVIYPCRGEREKDQIGKKYTKPESEHPNKQIMQFLRCGKDFPLQSMSMPFKEGLRTQKERNSFSFLRTHIFCHRSYYFLWFSAWLNGTERIEWEFTDVDLMFLIIFIIMVTKWQSYLELITGIKRDIREGQGEGIFN